MPKLRVGMPPILHAAGTNYVHVGKESVSIVSLRADMFYKVLSGL
jgi:hypothetical protein